MFTNNTSAFRSLALAVFAALLASCVSSSAPTSDGTVSQTKALASEFEKLKTALTSTMTALDGIQASTGTEGFFNKKDVVVGDLESSVKTYSKARSGLVSQNTRVTKKKEGLKKEFESYLVAWEKSMAEVQNEDLLKAAEMRRGEARERFELVRKDLDKMVERNDSLLSDLQGIEAALKNDMTAQGVSSIEGVIEGAAKKGAGVHDDIDTIIKALSDYSAALATRQPAAQAAP